MNTRKPSVLALALILALAGNSAAQTPADTTGPYPSRGTNEVTRTTTTSGTYDNNANTGSSLPATASPLPLLGVLGAGALALGTWFNGRQR